VRYVAEGLDTGAYERQMRAILEEYFGSDLTIAFEPGERIEPEPSGKVLMCKRTFAY
jgi:hypothetical protein